jgi:hypothetical protein
MSVKEIISKLEVQEGNLAALQDFAPHSPKVLETIKTINELLSVLDSQTKVVVL